MFPDADIAHQALTEDAIRNEMENGECLCWLSIYYWGYMPSDAQSVHCMCITQSLAVLFVSEEQSLVKELVDLSTRDRIRAIRDLPMSFEEKKQIRCVLIEKHFYVSLLLFMLG